MGKEKLDSNVRKADVLDQKLISGKKKLFNLLGENSRDISVFIEKYKKEKDISVLLNQTYYNKDGGGFNLGTGFNKFYIEGDTVFANNTWDSRVFKIDEKKLINTGEKYREIEKIGKYYVGVNISTKNEFGNETKINGSEKYILLDDKGKKIRNLNGSLLFDEEQQRYREYIKSGEEFKRNIYDKDLNIMAKNIPNNVNLLSQEDDKYLFIDNKSQKYSILQKGNTREERLEDMDEIHRSGLFLKYKHKQHSATMQKDKERRLSQNLPLNFDIEFEDNTVFVKSINDKDGNIIFEANDGLKYKIASPRDLKGKNPVKSHKQTINKGIFLLEGLNDDKYQKDVFINANSDVVLEFSDMAGATSIKDNILEHFVDNNHSELYNLDGEKLGMVSKYFNNEHNFSMVSTENDKNKLVENKTGKLKSKEFDKVLRKYIKGDKKIVIVENDGEISAIEIQM